MRAIFSLPSAILKNTRNNHFRIKPMKAKRGYIFKTMSINYPELISCPKDQNKHYFRSSCEDIFRKGNIRYWCKDCIIFKSENVLDHCGEAVKQAINISPVEIEKETFNELGR